MGKESRAKASAPEIMLSCEDVPAIAVLALLDALTIDAIWTAKSSPVHRDIRQHRESLLLQIKEKVASLHETYKGRVTGGMITHCDRYLCRVQDAMDNFFEEITEADLTDMELTKAKWPVEVAL